MYLYEGRQYSILSEFIRIGCVATEKQNLVHDVSKSTRWSKKCHTFQVRQYRYV